LKDVFGVFAGDKNVDILPGIKLRIFMVKYTAVTFDILNEILS